MKRSGPVITISGSIQGIGGAGTTTGGDGADIDIGDVFAGTPISISITGTAVIRSRAGAGGTTNGTTGSILIDAVGVGGANVSVAGGATVEVLDGSGTSVPANVTID